MARVKIEDIVDHLSSDMRRALTAAIEQHAPDADLDTAAIFRSFKRAVGRRCNTWETVPDHFVEK